MQRSKGFLTSQLAEPLQNPQDEILRNPASLLSHCPFSCPWAHRNTTHIAPFARLWSAQLPLALIWQEQLEQNRIRTETCLAFLNSWCRAGSLKHIISYRGIAASHTCFFICFYNLLPGCCLNLEINCVEKASSTLGRRRMRYCFFWHSPLPPLQWNF